MAKPWETRFAESCMGYRIGRPACWCCGERRNPFSVSGVPVNRRPEPLLGDSKREFGSGVARFRDCERSPRANSINVAVASRVAELRNVHIESALGRARVWVRGLLGAPGAAELAGLRGPGVASWRRPSEPWRMPERPSLAGCFAALISPCRGRLRAVGSPVSFWREFARRLRYSRAVSAETVFL